MNLQVVLTILSGSRKGTAQTFDRPGTYSIGREDQRDMVFPNDNEHLNISRHHCDLQIISLDPPNITIIDHHSTHGTYHQGTKISQPTLLIDQDIFSIGETELQISLVSHNTNVQRPKTWRIAPQAGQGIEQKTTTPIHQELWIPIKRVGIGVVVLFILTWLGSSAYNFATGSGKQSTTPVTATSPTTTTSTSATPATTKNSACEKIDEKMKAAQLKSSQVDQVFWQKHPDRKSKLINANDSAAQKEWCEIAAELAGKK
jgi:pSer/pThr/pTyr-binding forkhead associated (FHA) protein